ncbi:TBC domain containing protein [Tritrichomonas foetus]|uniref:TBC domain containing protein n=1 Tax=Tritrichomonas foetus TaxID=1144522 RepID=A0A1J4JMS0_9EUKA|nr:TBC domain containing protein [Tritrichomonas foetus]|eukprot:OHS98845.1 TBC domain containing protein [Tritrichomonas foetus]
MQQANEIYSIFHEVTVNLQDQSKMDGSFVICNQMGEFVFWWRQYSKPKKNDDVKPFEIILHANNISKIILNFQDTACYLLISTISPSNMFQFSFPQASYYQLMQFSQMLAIKQQMSGSESLEDAMDFISSTYYGSETPKRHIDLNIIEGRIEFPSFLSPSGLLPQTIDVVQPDLQTSAQFGVHGDDYMSNPVSESDFKLIPNIKVLKDLVRDRGVAKDIRYIVWPLLCNVLPFDETKRQKMLELRTNEYISIRKQWKTLSKHQLKYFSLLKESFSTIHVDVKRTHPPEFISSVPNWSQMLTSILRSFSLWNLNVRYTQGLNDIVVNFMGIFLPHMNKELTADEVEALTFWCFSSFVEIIESGINAENMMLMQMKELKIIGEIISHFNQKCDEFFRLHHLSDLSFIISSLILVYARNFAMDDVIRVWESVVCAKSPASFLRYFSASLLIHSFPSISMIPDCSLGKVVSVLDKIFIKQNIGNVIGVSIAMMSKNAIKEPEDLPAVEEPIVSPMNPFFTLDFSSATIYKENGSLFI